MLLYAITIFCSAFLLFLVQPIIAKQILPWFGGSATVWTTCLVFFQTTLLIGYAYSTSVLSRQALGEQVGMFEADLRRTLLACDPRNVYPARVRFWCAVGRRPRVHRTGGAVL